MALTVLFSWLALPALVLAQSPPQYSEQEGYPATGKNAVSLTTTDLLNSQDFAPQVTASPSQRSRFVNPVKKSKKGFTIPTSVEGDVNVSSATTQKPNLIFGNEVGTEMMTPTQRSTRQVEGLPAMPGPLPMTVNSGATRIDELVVQSAQRNGIDPQLIFAVMKQESSFNPQAISYKGARGLMQLMPPTAARFGVRDIFDPAQNIEGGARYLRFLLDTFNGDIELALAGYNAGENAVIRYGYQIPPYRETQDYVRKITANYARLKNGVAPQLPRPMNSNPTGKKGNDGEVITVGRTMTQY